MLTNSLDLPGIALIFFRFPCNFAIEVSPLFQTTPVSAKKITVEGMGVFFPISKRKTESKGKEKETFFSWNQPTTRTHFHLSREYQLLTYSLDFFKTKIGSKRLVVIYPPVGGGRGAWTIQMANVKIFKNFFIYYFFLTALLTITQVTYSKLNSQDKNEIYVQSDLKW